MSWWHIFQPDGYGLKQAPGVSDEQAAPNTT